MASALFVNFQQRIQQARKIFLACPKILLSLNHRSVLVILLFNGATAVAGTFAFRKSVRYIFLSSLFIDNKFLNQKFISNTYYILSPFFLSHFPLHARTTLFLSFFSPAFPIYHAFFDQPGVVFFKII